MENEVMQKNNNKNSGEEKRNTNRALKGAVIGLSITAAVLGATTLGFGIGYGVTQSQANSYSMQLDNIYKKNYYELVDGVNSADIQISKLLAADSEKLQAKSLSDLSESSKMMQSNIAGLPLSNENIISSVRFINQMSGYTQILEDKLSQGGTLTQEDRQTLQEMHSALTDMKRYLNQMSQKLTEGYSILHASENMNGDYDEFSLDFAQIKTDDTDYPTMIYDGPFSDSVVNKKITGLSGEQLSKEEVYKKVDAVFKNISNLKYDGESKGRFDTYNFILNNSDGQKIFVQATKKGGHVLTVSGQVTSDNKQISLDQAEKIALTFAKDNGVENPSSVWHEELNGFAYFNIAPTQNGIVLYPDLVKVKVDMEHGDVIGYDAMNYFTNHTKRNLGTAVIAENKVREFVDGSFTVKSTGLVLAPLEYNREVLCWEFECERDGATYYLYYNASTGEQENVLKVVETSDGSKLM